MPDNAERTKNRFVSGELPLQVFVSSVMNNELQKARDETFKAFYKVSYLHVWAFERTPASSEPADDTYLSKARESDIFIWLVGSSTTDSVFKELKEAQSTDRRILGFKFAVDNRDERTKKLIENIRSNIKYVEVETHDEFREALELTLVDEIIRAMRAKPHFGRLARLEELARASRARCISRWQAAGISYAEAMELANDSNIGKPHTNLKPNESNGVRLLVAEVGAGKSLIAERLLQEAITRARDDINSPIPIYLEAREAVGKLNEAVIKETDGLGEPRVQGAFVVIDGADETGTAQAGILLNEIRVLAETLPKTSIILTSRPLPIFSEVDEKVSIPLLSKEDSYNLIERFAKREISNATAYDWPKSVRDAISRPLFSILLGFHLRNLYESPSPSSTAELLSSLVERSLQNIEIENSNYKLLLQKLAVLSTDRNGGPVPSTEVASRTELQALFSSRLVVEKSGLLYFPLPILTQWFASQALGDGTLNVNELVEDSERLENWKYPLIIFTGTFHHDAVTDVITPIVETSPAFASEIIKEGLATWGHVEEVQPPPAEECGRRVKSTTQAWVKGIGNIAKLIAPVNEQDTLLPIGARTRECWLETAWYEGEDIEDEINILPRNVPHFDKLFPFSIGLLASYPENVGDGWIQGMGARPGSKSAWAWRWSLDRIVYSLSNILKRKNLFLPEGPLLDEVIWATAIQLTSRRWHETKPIPLDVIEDGFSRLKKENNIQFNLWDIFALRKLESKYLKFRNNGIDELLSPWPGTDKEIMDSKPVWESYSDEQILARAKAIYNGALIGYKQLVDTWFPKFSERLSTYAILPACLVGVVIPPNRVNRLEPIISWYLDPLPNDKETFIELNLGDKSHRWEDIDTQSIRDRLNRLRPIASNWIHITLSAQTLYMSGSTPEYDRLDLFGPNWAIELAYKWLIKDLKNVYWVK